MKNGPDTAVKTTPNIIREPRIYVVGRQNVDRVELDKFLGEYGMTWETDTEMGGEQLVEAGGRLCYVSYGKGRKTNAEYINNIIESKHGSVLEHAVWNFIIAGVSRSFTHELIRHRAGWGYSQLSQRYVDESTANFVMPPAIIGDEVLAGSWREQMEAAQKSYVTLVESLMERYAWVGDKIHRRKMAREAARGVLPNSTETKIVVTGNARAWRTMLELRSSEGAEQEIRRCAVAILKILDSEAPGFFSDFEIYQAVDRCDAVRISYHKV